MKKMPRKLSLNRETIRNLQADALGRVQGGAIPSASSCPSIDGDTCMCRTQDATCTCGPTPKSIFFWC